MSYFKIIFIGLLMVQLGCACESVESDQEVRSRIYNSALIEKELTHLDKLQPTEEVEQRRSQLLEGKKIIIESNADIVYLGIRPPLPCPGRTGETSPHCFPGNPDFGDIVIGSISDHINESSAQFIDVKTSEVVAQGELLRYDKEFLTAWFKFELLHADMAGNELMLKVNTVVDGDNGTSVITMEDTFPPGTFGGK